MNANKSNNPWFVSANNNSSAKVRMFCFPYAGGSAEIFNQWQQFMSSDVEVLSVQYPGRGRRLNENLIDDCTVMVDEIWNTMQAYLDKPIILLGYSMGGLISIELAKKIQKKSDAKLMLQIVCAYQPNTAVGRFRYLMTDPELIEELTRLGGIDEKLLNNKDFLSFLFPVLRADFKILDNFKHQAQLKIDSNALIIHGSNDTMVSAYDQNIWQKIFSGKITARTIEGDHFFITNNSTELLDTINFQIKFQLNTYQPELDRASF